MSRKLHVVALIGAIVAALTVALTASAEELPSGKDVPEGAVPVGDTLVFAGGGIVMGVGPLAYDDCSAGRFCMWDSVGYSGTWVYRTSSGWYNLTTFDDRAESARNNSAQDGMLATGYGGAGSQQCHNAGGHYYSLGATFNNQVSSWNFGISC